MVIEEEDRSNRECVYFEEFQQGSKSGGGSVPWKQL